MRTTEQIQLDYAKSKNYETFEDLLIEDKPDLDWHVSVVQKEYAKELIEYLDLNILSIKDKKGIVLSIGDKVKFSDRFDTFVLSEINFNVIERRVELHGDGLFCTLNESDYTVVNHAPPHEKVN